MTNFLIPRGIALTVTSSGALTAGQHTPVDTTSGNQTMTLPTPPTTGAYLSVEKVDSTPNTVTISGSIRGGASTVTLTTQYETLTFVWSGTTWRPTEGHRTKTAIDSAIDAKIGTQATSDSATYATLTQQLLGWAYTQSYRVVSATRDGNEAITTASVVWPDGATGTFTTDTASTSFPGAIDAYHVTHILAGTTSTVTQPAVTRDTGGAVTAQPAVTIT